MHPRKTLVLCAVSLGLAGLLIDQLAHAESPPVGEWIHQSGKPRYDYFGDVAISDSGAIFASGYQSTPSDLEDILTIGVVQKYDATGGLLWTNSVGNAANRVSLADIETDSSGSLYFAGSTTGSFAGPNAGPAGYSDAILRKLSPLGGVLWSKQIGATGNDGFSSLSHDGIGHLYFAGYTHGSLAGPNQGVGDAILGKYDEDGNLEWSRQLGGTLRDTASAVAADALGNIYMGGSTANDLGGSLGGLDGFLAKYDPSGNQIWLRQFGSPADDGGVSQLAVDGLGNVYAMETTGRLQAATFMLSKYASDGSTIWSRVIGSNYQQFGLVFGLSADPLGNVYISGGTSHDLGALNAGGHDAFVRKYDASGNVLWTYQVGTDNGDWFHDVATDGHGNLVVVGETGGSLAIPNPAYSRDAIITLLRESPVPEPHVISLVFSAGVLLLIARSKSRRTVPRR